MSLSRTRYRKRVQAYNDALNAGTSQDSDMAHFVRVSDSVGDIAEAPDDTFVLGLRAKLVHEASNAPVAGKRAHEAKSGRASRRIPPASGPRRKAVAVLASSVVALGSLGVLSGSVNALPGQTLYPVKRGFENSRIALAQEPATLGERHLDLAARRLDEAKQLTLSQGNARLITKTLSAFTAEVDKGAELLFEAYGQSQDNGTIERVATSLTRASEALNDLSRTVPDASGQAYESAAETVYELHAKAINICPECNIDPLAELPPTLLANADEDGAEYGGQLLGAPPSEESKSPRDDADASPRQDPNPAPSDEPDEREPSDGNGAERNNERSSTDDDSDDLADKDGDHADDPDESSGPLQRFFSPLTKGFKSFKEGQDSKTDEDDETEQD